MNIEKMSDAGANKSVEEIRDGLKEFVANNPDQARNLLAHMIDDLLDPLSEDDYCGTEGWEVGLGAA
jgi:hypothetical protein